MRRVDLVFHGCAALVVAALVALDQLRRPSSWLSRKVDARIDAAIAAEFARDGAR